MAVARGFDITSGTDIRIIPHPRSVAQHRGGDVKKERSLIASSGLISLACD